VELSFDEDWRFADATLMPAFGGKGRVSAIASALQPRQCSAVTSPR
jgi:hypothetical protein